MNAVLQSVASVEDSSINSVHETDEVMYTRLAEMAVSDDKSESGSTSSRLHNSVEQSCDLGQYIIQHFLHLKDSGDICY